MIYSLRIASTDEIISFSSVTDFSENLSATVTMHETEVGFPISDNVVFSNPEFSISGVFSYYNSADRQIFLVDGEFVVRQDDNKPVETHIDIEKKIRNIYESKQPFSIIKSTSLDDISGTEVDRIDSCVMRGLVFNTTADRHGAVFPSMQIVQVRQATVLEEDVPNAIPQIVPILNQNATSTTAKQATESGTDKPPNEPATSQTAADKAVKGDPEAIKRLSKAMSEAESKMVQANLWKSINAQIKSGDTKAYEWDVLPSPNTGGWVIIKPENVYRGQ